MRTPFVILWTLVGMTTRGFTLNLVRYLTDGTTTTLQLACAILWPPLWGVTAHKLLREWNT